MTMSQGSAIKTTDALLNSRRYKKHEQTFTLRNIVDQLHSKSEKMDASNMKRAAILESLQQASRHNITCGKAKDSLFNMKLMIQSRQEQIKTDGRAASHEWNSQRQHSAKIHQIKERASTAVSSGWLSTNASITRGNEEEKYCTKDNLKTMKGIAYNQNGIPQSFYSRHISNVQSSHVKEDKEIDFVKYSATNNQSKVFLKPEIETLATLGDEGQHHLESYDYSKSKDVFVNVSARGNSASSDIYPTAENISSKEKEVLNSLTDPQLKESLQNIIKRRRSSVRFIKDSDSGYEMTNLDKTIHEQVEQIPNDQPREIVQLQSTDEKPANSDTSRSVSRNIRKASANRRCFSSAATSHSESVRETLPHMRKTSRQEQNISSVRGASSARSCFSAVSSKNLSCPILKRRKPELQMEETRVIRPASTKGYAPNLTHRKLSRKISAISPPSIRLQKQKPQDLAEVNMFREFLLIYAKVATKSKTDRDDTRKPIRMMSQTPELVIKSAIGQFLTRAFPSGNSQDWSGLHARSKKERYEEQQRSKLLRIKTCMKHLAAVA